jgi:hypothetical protein
MPNIDDLIKSTPQKAGAQAKQHAQADLTASVVITQEDGQANWQHYFAVWQVRDGYFKGKDRDGNIIVVQTREAKDALSGDVSASARRPDLFIYRETDDETGKSVWDEITVAWKGKKAGIFKAKTDEGDDIVIQTKEAKAANFSRKRLRRIDAIDLGTAFSSPDSVASLIVHGEQADDDALDSADEEAEDIPAPLDS